MSSYTVDAMESELRFKAEDRRRAADEEAPGVFYGTGLNPGWVAVWGNRQRGPFKTKTEAQAALKEMSKG